MSPSFLSCAGFRRRHIHAMYVCPLAGKARSVEYLRNYITLHPI